MKTNNEYSGLEIAIIGLSCRFPGASTWRDYWNNLEHGVESIRFSTHEELLSEGIEADIINQKNFVKAQGIIKDKELFDYTFFDYRPIEAGLMNPTHRVFHECVWEALEDAGCDPGTVKGQIGIYAGSGEDSNWKLYALLKNRNKQIDEVTIGHLSNKDYLSSLISYKLNLRGPAFSMHTACSTSLVAINLACSGLLLGEADIAVAGGVSIITQKEGGYVHGEGTAKSSDGHCRAFDKDASGTTPAEGAGVVVLKRLSEALADNDNIYAIIKGGAINNDGIAKVGYTAPSVKGQVACIKKALNFANVSPESIGYVEAHGTGTRLGDPIEVMALNEVFGNKRPKSSIALGSVKTNIGHLDTAAGVAGLIKAALCLKYKKIPPTLHFKEANPDISFNDGPFYVNTVLSEWKKTENTPRRAGVSSFGIGGTNAHIVLEEAPDRKQEIDDEEDKLINISAKTENALIRYLDKLSHYVESEKELDLADMSYTFLTARKCFNYRLTATYRNKTDLMALLRSENLANKIVKTKGRLQLVFMFSGAGSQYASMGKDLYENETFFRQKMDEGFDFLAKMTGYDYKQILYPTQPVDQAINRMLHTQPLIFLFEYSLAMLMESYGVFPEFMIGHSIGEYVAACLSGVFSYEEALRLVVRRGELLDTLETGAMISASMNEDDALRHTSSSISLAALNSPGQVVFSGSEDAIGQLKDVLESEGINCVKLHASVAGHSPIMESILPEYRKELNKVKLRAPQKSFVSNLTGNYITESECVSVDYWLRHMRETVKFSAGVSKLLKQEGAKVFIEVGSGHSLKSLLKQHKESHQADVRAINLIRHIREVKNDMLHFKESLGLLWSIGVEINWTNFYKNAKRRKISLPTYAFEPIKHPVVVDSYKLLVTNYSLNNSIDSGHFDSHDLMPEYKRERPDDVGELACAETPTEIKLKGIFEAFFGINNIGIDDSFFDLGGDSLKALSILAIIKKEFNINLAFRDLFEKQTIRLLSILLDELQVLLQKTDVTNVKTIKI